MKSNLQEVKTNLQEVKTIQDKLGNLHVILLCKQ